MKTSHHILADIDNLLLFKPMEPARLGVSSHLVIIPFVERRQNTLRQNRFPGNVLQNRV